MSQYVTDCPLDYTREVVKHCWDVSNLIRANHPFHPQFPVDWFIWMSLLTV